MDVDGEVEGEVGGTPFVLLDFSSDEDGPVVQKISRGRGARVRVSDDEESGEEGILVDDDVDMSEEDDGHGAEPGGRQAQMSESYFCPLCDRRLCALGSPLCLECAAWFDAHKPFSVDRRGDE